MDSSGNIGPLGDVMANTERERRLRGYASPVSESEAQGRETAAKLGYRQLSDAETACVLNAREIGQEIKKLLDDPRMKDADPRWKAIATTHFQEALMALVRSITRPTFF